MLALLIGGFLLWRRHNDAQELANGDVHCDGCMTPVEHARFLKENAGETVYGANDRENRTARGEPATDFQDAAPASAGPQQNGLGADGSLTRSAGVQGSGVGQQPASALAAHASQVSPDTLPPNAENGARFGGNGPYQWYRQGNITWRIDTASGRSCIIYATLEEWRKPIVISHGCGPNA